VDWLALSIKFVVFDFQRVYHLMIDVVLSAVG
jgi:hypothetical protein